jgi:antitoxin ParD1/3/4
MGCWVPVWGGSVMNAEIPADLAPFVQRLVAERRFLTEGDVLAEGLRLLQARETLRQEVRMGFDQLDAGLGVDASEVYCRAIEVARIVHGSRDLRNL